MLFSSNIIYAVDNNTSTNSILDTTEDIKVNENKNVKTSEDDDKEDSWVLQFIHNPIGFGIKKISNGVVQLGDAIQVFCNSIQADEDVDRETLFSYNKLKDGAEGTGDINKYTNVAKYGEGDTTASVEIELKKDGNDNDDADYRKSTKIPVIIGDFYNIAVGHIDCLSINFLTGNQGISENAGVFVSIWLTMRNFVVLVIRAIIYLASGILVIFLVWNGVEIVAHSVDNPQRRAQGKKNLVKFVKALGILIGMIVMMGLFIFASQSMFNSADRVDSYELPIRVNVEDTYSFSTTITGYVRYLAASEDIDNFLQIAGCTLLYIILTLGNVIFIIFMVIRMIIIWLLSIYGSILSVQYAFGKSDTSSFMKWAVAYGCISMISVVYRLIYILILNVIG